MKDLVFRNKCSLNIFWTQQLDELGFEFVMFDVLITKQLIISYAMFLLKRYEMK